LVFCPAIFNIIDSVGSELNVKCFSVEKLMFCLASQCSSLLHQAVWLLKVQ